MKHHGASSLPAGLFFQFSYIQLQLNEPTSHKCSWLLASDHAVQGATVAPAAAIGNIREGCSRLVILFAGAPLSASAQLCTRRRSQMRSLCAEAWTSDRDTGPDWCSLVGPWQDARTSTACLTIAIWLRQTFNHGMGKKQRRQEQWQEQRRQCSCASVVWLLRRGWLRHMAELILELLHVNSKQSLAAAIRASLVGLFYVW